MKLAALITLFIASTSFAKIASFTKDKGDVDFLAIGNPSALKIHGEGRGPEGTLDVTDKTITGELTFDLESLHTGINKRDEHMKKKYLETKTFPKATLKLTKVDLAGKSFDGTLSLHGKEKPVHGTVEASEKDGTTKVTAEFKINMEDFAIDVPKFAGITVAKDVTVTVKSEASIK